MYLGISVMRGVRRDERRRLTRPGHHQPHVGAPLPHEAHRRDEHLDALVLLEPAEEQDARRRGSLQGLGSGRRPVRDHDDSGLADDRREFADKRLPVHHKPVGTAEPAPEGPVLAAREGWGARMAQRVVHRQNRSVSRRQRQQTGVVVLVHVNDLRPPPAQLLTDLEHRGNGGCRPHPARQDQHPDPVSPQALEEVVSLRRRAPELEGVRATQYCNVLAGMY